MFTRSVLRSAAPLRNTIRRYATGPAASGGSALPYVIGAGALGAGGYYYYANVLGKAPSVPNLPAPGQQRGQNPQGPSPTSSQDAIAAMAFTGGDQGFVSLKLEKVEDINHNTKKFIFALPEGDQQSGLKICSALITKFKPEGKEKPVIRPYTPTSDEDAIGYIELIVKKYDGGPMSEHIHSLKPGQTLEVKGPIPKYAYQANKHEHISCIAGGTGITPMWQLIRAIFKNPEDKTKVTLIFGNLTEEDILLKDKLDELENTYPQRFRAFYVLDNPPKDWEQGKGHVTKELLKQLLPEPKETNSQVFVCGPPGLYKAVSGAKKSPQDQGELTGYLKELGYEKEQVYKF